MNFQGRLAASSESRARTSPAPSPASPRLFSAAAFPKSLGKKKNKKTLCPCGGEEFQAELLELLQGLGRLCNSQSSSGALSSLLVLLAFKERTP